MGRRDEEEEENEVENVDEYVNRYVEEEMNEDGSDIKKVGAHSEARTRTRCSCLYGVLKRQPRL
jgi:hypothetical protein